VLRLALRFLALERLGRIRSSAGGGVADAALHTGLIGDQNQAEGESYPAAVSEPSAGVAASISPRRLWPLAGIVNLAARGMLVVSVAGGSGRKVLCSPIVLPRSNRAGPQKGALGPLS
jgi:hypothetical protein